MLRVFVDLQAVKFDPPNRLVLCNGNVLAERIKAHVERERVAVLVDAPLTAPPRLGTLSHERMRGGYAQRAGQEQPRTIWWCLRGRCRRIWPAGARAATHWRTAPATSCPGTHDESLDHDSSTAGAGIFLKEVLLPRFVARGDANGHGPREGKWTLCSSRRRGGALSLPRLTIHAGLPRLFDARLSVPPSLARLRNT